MRAALIHAPGDMRMGEVPQPEIGADHVLVKVHACGVCPSDVRYYAGTSARPMRPPPYVPGHEWSGTVLAVGADVATLAPGDRVAANPRVVCGHCYYCGRGMSNYCENLRRTVRGGFAEYGVGPASNLYKVPDGVSFEEASFAEPLACCINGSSNTGYGFGDTVVVVGAGPIGLIHVQLARAAGSRVISVEPIAQRLEVAARLGAHATVDPTAEDAVARVKALTDGRGANAVVVAVGNKAAAAQALEMTATGAAVNLFAGFHPPQSIELDLNTIHYKQLRLTGSHDFTPHHFRAGLQMMADHTVDLEPLISHRLPLDETKRGFDTVIAREGLKVMVHVDGG
jgi:L-iditol 2-dehydrogenase